MQPKTVRGNLNSESGVRILLNLKVNQQAIQRHIENNV